MDDALLVGQPEGAGHVAQEREDVERPERAARGARMVSSESPVEQLHHQEGRAVLGVADVEDVDDARVADAAADARLGEEALDGGGISRGDGGQHHLDGHLAAEGVVDRRPYDAHAALPEEADQPVTAPDHVSRGKHAISPLIAQRNRPGGQGSPASPRLGNARAAFPDAPRAWARAAPARAR